MIARPNTVKSGEPRRLAHRETGIFHISLIAQRRKKSPPSLSITASIVKTEVLLPGFLPTTSAICRPPDLRDLVQPKYNHIAAGKIRYKFSLGLCALGGRQEELVAGVEA
jgi:hypothetical protein